MWMERMYFAVTDSVKRSEESVRKIIIQRKVGAQTAQKEAGIGYMEA